MISLVQHFEAFQRSHPQNPVLRNNPENFHPCDFEKQRMKISQGAICLSISMIFDCSECSYNHCQSGLTKATIVL